jgi:hypothetical protein
MLKSIPIKESKEYQALVAMRLKASIANIESLARSVSAIAEELNSERYLSSQSCLAVTSALQDVLATAKINAQGHATEGF